MPEVHFIGGFVGATDFSANNLFLKYEILSGGEWSLLDGTCEEGQTQLSLVNGYHDNLVIWNHPIDLYYTTKSLQGWPRLNVQVWNEDKFGRKVLCGYGTTKFPAQPGETLVECVIWRPQGCLSQKMYNFFLDVTSHVEHPDIVYSSKDRFDLSTSTVGSIYFNVDVVTRGFKNSGVVFKGAP